MQRHTEVHQSARPSPLGPLPSQNGQVPAVGAQPPPSGHQEATTAALQVAKDAELRALALVKQCEMQAEQLRQQGMATAMAMANQYVPDVGELLAQHLDFLATTGKDYAHTDVVTEIEYPVR